MDSDVAPVDCDDPTAIDCRPPRLWQSVAPARRAPLDLQTILNRNLQRRSPGSSRPHDCPATFPGLTDSVTNSWCAHGSPFYFLCVGRRAFARYYLRNRYDRPIHLKSVRYWRLPTKRRARQPLDWRHISEPWQSRQKTITLAWRIVSAAVWKRLAGPWGHIGQPPWDRCRRAGTTGSSVQRLDGGFRFHQAINRESAAMVV